MKRNRFSFLHRRAAFIGLAGLGSAASLLAQQAPAQQQQPQPADPFVKKVAKAAVPDAAGSPALAHPATLQFALATVGIPMQEYATLIQKSANSAAMYARAKELLAGGQASLEDVESITTHNGQRAKVTSVDELPVIQRYSAPDHGGQTVWPTDESRLETGYSWEIDTVTLPGQPGSFVNMDFEQQQLLRFTEWKAGAAAPSQWQPAVEDRRQTLAVLAPDSTPQYLGTLSHSERGGSKDDAKEGQTVHLLFLRAQNVPYDETPPATATKNKANNLRLTYTVYSMDRKLALALLMDGEATGESLHEDVLKQVREQKASLEKIATLLMRSGQRTAMDESTRFPYPADPSLQGSESSAGKVSNHGGKNPAPPQAAYFSEFSSRSVGWRFEAEPVLDEKTGTIDLNISSLLDQFRGNLTKPAPSLPDQPVFGSQKIVTSLSLPAGRHALLGTINPPHHTGVNGRGDDGKVWLAFVGVTLD